MLKIRFHAAPPSRRYRDVRPGRHPGRGGVRPFGLLGDGEPRVSGDEPAPGDDLGPEPVRGPSGRLCDDRPDRHGLGSHLGQPAGQLPEDPGSTPAEEGATGPASATLVVQGVAAKDVVTALENGLKGAGYTTDALSGPLEDGTYTLDMHGSQAGCQVQVTASPTGGLTTIRILYGAACPKA